MGEDVLKLDSLALKTGMELAEDIFNEEGILVLGKGTILDEKIISKLISQDIKNIPIKQQIGASPSFINSQKLKLFSSVYQEKEESIKYNLKAIKEGRSLNYGHLYNTSKDILQTLEEPKDIFKYLRALRRADHSIYTHSINVSLICSLFADWFRFPPRLKKDLVITGLLHDLGKIILGIEKLEDHQKYENHPQLGYSLLAAQGASKAIQLGVLMHHEKEDGSGFPTKSKWSNIHPFAKIVSLANYYDHATSDGKYLQEKVCPFSLIRLVEENRYGQFDIRFADMLLNKIATYHLGETVRLNNGKLAKMVFVSKHHLSRPIIKVGDELIDLYWEKDLVIEELID